MPYPTPDFQLSFLRFFTFTMNKLVLIFIVIIKPILTMTFFIIIS